MIIALLPILLVLTNACFERGARGTVPMAATVPRHSRRRTNDSYTRGIWNDELTAQALMALTTAV
jgi:hypothetical protein